MSDGMTEVVATPDAWCTVIAVVALPPGGGKSTLFSSLHSDYGAAIVSSDQIKASGLKPSAFETELNRLVGQGGARLICYDKNVPNAQGVAKLVKVCRDASQRKGARPVRLLLVVPESLSRSACWQRVLSRPASHIGLSQHTVEGGLKKCRAIFDMVFFKPSADYLPTASSLPGTLRTGGFFETAGASSGLAKQIVLACSEESQTTSIGALESALMDDGVLGLGDDACVSGGRSSHGSGGGRWVSAELPGTALHVTLVPPTGGIRGAAETDGAKAALSRFLPLAAAGTLLQVSLGAYHLARCNGKQVAFWEVSSIDGLDPECHYAPQALCYHVTDRAALKGCQAMEAGDMLRAIRAGKVPSSWRLRTIFACDAGEDKSTCAFVAAVKLRG